MLETPKCYIRHCKHFTGIVGEEEDDQFIACKAFPDGIPIEITMGNNDHSKVIKGQTGNFVFEKK